MAKNKPSSKRILSRVEISDTKLLFTALLCIAIVILLTLTAFYGIIMLIVSPPSLSFPTFNLGSENDDASYPFRQEIELKVSNDTETAEGISGTSSQYSVLMKFDGNDGKIIASRRSSTVMYPASLTKIMTLIVVVENLKSEEALNDVLEIKIPRGEHSGFGFEIGEKLTVKDLIYASILQSDGVACITLAEYIAGSESNFVKMMNDKARELGLSEQTTLFQNCSGLHHQYHYSTAYDMAIITAYAMKNTFCANVLTTLKYYPSDVFRPDEGCVFWSKLLHNHMNDGSLQPPTAKILGGKTGLTEPDTSGYCIATFANGKDGAKYVLITAKAESWATAVDDTIKIYKNHIK